MAETSSCTIKQDQITEKDSRSWADLPNGIICEVYSRIYSADWSVFRSVCRSWKHARALTIRHQPRIDRLLPYLLMGNNKIYYPMFGACDNGYMLDKSSLVENKPGAIVHAAKDGWLLVTYRNNDIFFYNPSTKAVVQLPDFASNEFDSMGFSAPPTSKSWVVVISILNRIDEITIFSIKDGEDTWSSSSFILTTYFKFSKCNVVILKEMYYFLGKYGKLMVHDPKSNKFYFHKAGKSICEEFKAYGGQQYMLENDGKLLVVFVNFDGSLIRTYKWDVSKKEWEIVESLGNNMLFVSATSCVCEKALIKGTGNKIYFPRFVGDHCLFYSLSSKRYHAFEGGSYRSFNGSKFYFNCIWMKD